MKKFLVFMLCALLFQSCCICKKLKVSKDVALIAGVGKSGIKGGKSWKDPIAGQIGVESKLVELNENSSFGAGLEVSFQGAAYEEEDFSGKVTTSYINIPLLYTYKSNSGFYGEIGLQPGFLISAKDKFDGGRYDYKDFMKNFELGLPFGAGYNINDKFSVGARATLGITNLDNTGSNVKDHNYLIVGLVRYRLAFQNKKESK